MIKVYSRSDMGTSYNVDNPGVNGLFEIRPASETSLTGTRPLNTWYPMLSMKTPDNIAMMQIAGADGSFYIRGKQGASVTMANATWKRIMLGSMSLSGTTLTLTI